MISSYGHRFLTNKCSLKPLVIDTNDAGAIHFKSKACARTAIAIIENYEKEHKCVISFNNNLPQDLRQKLEQECGKFMSSHDWDVRLEKLRN